MTARILSGREASAAWLEEVGERASRLARRGSPPGLATLLVGDDPASQVYVRMKHRAAAKAGVASFDVRLPASSSQEQVLAEVARLNEDEQVHGFLVQLPLPAGIEAAPVLQSIDPAKDADGLHAVNLGRLVLGLPSPGPATPTGILRLLDHYGIDMTGRRVTIVGRSQLVGRPLAIMMSAPGRDATVTVAHSRTRDLMDVTRAADILVVAIGSPGLVGAEHVQPGAVVIDVGTTKVGDALTGDVDFDAAASIASAITPVPGGVGPMTIAALLANVVELAESAG